MKKLFLILLLILPLFSAKEIKVKNGGGCLEMDIMLLADLSQSVSGNEKFIHDALQIFTERFDLDDKGIRIGLIKFNDNATLMSHLTENEMQLDSAINTINERSTGGSTNMEDALIQTFQEFKENGRPLVRKIVVIISDGEPDRAAYVRDAAMFLKSFDGVAICGVYINQNGNPAFMREISSEFCYVESNYENLVSELEKLDICL